MIKKIPLFLFVMLLSVPLVYAVPETNHEDSYRHADIVLIGKILSSKIIVDDREDTEQTTYLDSIIYSVKVEQYLKNRLDSDLITVTGTYYPKNHNEPQWGVSEFDVGEHVLLYVSHYGESLVFNDYSSSSLEKPNIICDKNEYYDQGKCILNPHCPEKAILVNDFCAMTEQKNTFTSTGGGCLIATATFGSELTPQVQQLRELRDNVIMETDSGTNFMSGFNEFYYSFSPQIADYERENPVFKELIKITITPMLSTLSIMNYVDINSENEMLGYGTAIIMLNVGMYFGIPVLAVVGLRRYFQNS